MIPEVYFLGYRMRSSWELAKENVEIEKENERLTQEMSALRQQANSEIVRLHEQIEEIGW